MLRLKDLKQKYLHGWTIPYVRKQGHIEEESDLKRDYLISSSRCKTHASFDEVEHHERSHYMGEPSTMYGSVDVSKKRIESRKDYLIRSPKHTTHATLNETECHGEALT